MHSIIEFLTFKRMAAPLLLQVLFWAAIGGTLYGVWVLYQLGNWAWWIPLVVGPLVVRVLFERAILAFRTYDVLVELRDNQNAE